VLMERIREAIGLCLRVIRRDHFSNRKFPTNSASIPEE
jgi:hypothetical protein